MTTATISIPVDTELAQVYRSASVEEHQKLQLLLSLWLRELAKMDDIPLNQLMDEISDRAQARGLTPEILESLLNDDE